MGTRREFTTNNEEKILALLEKLNTTVGALNTTVEQHSGMFEKMQADISGLKDGQAQMQEDQKKMQEDISSIKARLDYDVDVRLTAISDAQEGIETRLDAIEKEVSETRKLAEATQDKVDVIHAAVSQHSADITELKAAN